MGSRGRMLSERAWDLAPQYKKVDEVNGVKVLKLADKPNHHKLPDISHTPGTRYLDLNSDGTLHTLRIYDQSRHPVIDIDYGEHTPLGEGKKLHIHFWKGSTSNRNNARLFTKSDWKKYGKYLKGVVKYEWIYR